MPIAISVLLLCLWIAVAWRAYQRGQLLLACMCALAGILLSLYRLKLWRARQRAREDDQPPA